jgi:hypothetical protein
LSLPTTNAPLFSNQKMVVHSRAEATAAGEPCWGAWIWKCRVRHMLGAAL